MRRKIILHGHLRKAFGDSFMFDVETAGEALRALNCAFPGKFVAAIREGSYQLIRGRRYGGMSIDIDHLNTFRLGSADLHIIPVAAGAAKGGTVKAVLGVALIGTAIFMSGGTLAAPLAAMSTQVVAGLGITWGNVALLGLGVALAGVSQAYAKAADDPKDAVDPAQSYSFSGPINVNEQGGAVPLIYGGPLIVGTQPISVRFNIENLGAY